MGVYVAVAVEEEEEEKGVCGRKESGLCGVGDARNGELGEKGAIETPTGVLAAVE